jgi:hypothetical protein
MADPEAERTAQDNARSPGANPVLMESGFAHFRFHGRIFLAANWCPLARKCFRLGALQQ